MADDDDDDDDSPTPMDLDFTPPQPLTTGYPPLPPSASQEDRKEWHDLHLLLHTGLYLMLQVKEEIEYNLRRTPSAPHLRVGQIEREIRDAAVEWFNDNNGLKPEPGHSIYMWVNDYKHLADLTTTDLWPSYHAQISEMMFFHWTPKLKASNQDARFRGQTYRDMVHHMRGLLERPYQSQAVNLPLHRKTRSKTQKTST